MEEDGGSTGVFLKCRVLVTTEIHWWEPIFKNFLNKGTKLKTKQLMRKNVVPKDNYTLMCCVSPEQDSWIRAAKNLSTVKDNIPVRHQEQGSVSIPDIEISLQINIWFSSSVDF